MLKAKDFRQKAWADLSGKWGMMALCTLIFELILGACAGLSIIAIGGVGVLLLSGPLTLGMTMLALNVVRGAEVKVETLFDGFKNFVSAFVLSLINTIFIALWSLLLIVPGIIKSLSYSMSFYILADNPDMAPNDARKESMVMMQGNKWRLFCLYFSFIGWLLLCGLTLGILTFWVTPYMESAKAEFYQSLLAEQHSGKVKPAPELAEHVEKEEPVQAQAEPVQPEAEVEPYAEPETNENTDNGEDL